MHRRFPLKLGAGQIHQACPCCCCRNNTLSPSVADCCGKLFPLLSSEGRLVCVYLSVIELPHRSHLSRVQLVCQAGKASTHLQRWHTIRPPTSVHKAPQSAQILVFLHKWHIASLIVQFEIETGPFHSQLPVEYCEPRAVGLRRRCCTFERVVKSWRACAAPVSCCHECYYPRHQAHARQG